jgi:hypothetical protein
MNKEDYEWWIGTDSPKAGRILTLQTKKDYETIGPNDG